MSEFYEGNPSREAGAEDITRDFTPVGLAFKKILGAFERDVGISPPKYFVLKMLAKESNLRQGEISELSGVDPSRITQLAKKMEREGLIDRTRAPEDNRVVHMRLTSKGRQALHLASERSKVLRSRVQGALSEEERRELRRLLGKLAEAMDGPGVSL